VRVVGVHVLAQEPHLVTVDFDDEHVLVLVVVPVPQRSPAGRLGRHPGTLGDHGPDLDLRVARLEQAFPDRLQEVVDDRLAPALRRESARHVVDLPHRVVVEELADRGEVPGAERREEPPHHVLGVTGNVGHGRPPHRRDGRPDGLTRPRRWKAPE
jgi:hypothetical protein